MSETETTGIAPQDSEPGNATSQRASRTRSRRSTIVMASLLALSGVAFATAFAFGVTRLHGGGQPPLMRPAMIPANVSTSLAELMQLSPVPNATAPGFTLTDQSGAAVSLASFRGKTVVLTFMDPHCTDVCPIVSREFIDARHDLGTAAGQVVFVAVNVNPYHRQISDVAAFSRDQQLSSLRSWYFLTGSVKSMHAVWDSYQIEVRAPNPNADVQHTSVIYFIDPQGRERYVVAPMDYHTKQGAAYLPAGQSKAWSRGIALVARDITK